VKSILLVTGLMTAFAGYLPANTVWNVGATFSYNSLGNVATGSFQLNPSLALVTWHITVGGTNAAADNVYTPGDSIAIFPDSTHLDFYDGSTNQYIDLYLQTGLSNAGGTINLLHGDGGATDNSTIVCAGCGTLNYGIVSTHAVPEPSPVLLVGSGGAILALGLLGRRRRLQAR
jgi:hypothetical protein